MTDGPPPTLAKMHAPMAAVALTVITVDQLTKMWANGEWLFDGLQRCQVMAEPPTVGFCLAYNEGMAFSVGWGSGAIIASVALAIVVVLVVAARKVPPGARLLMGAVAGGALGNVIDRALRAPAPGSSNSGFMSGAVVDFFYSKVWATFNVADAAIVVGGILLSIVLWRLPDPETEPAAAAAVPAHPTSEPDENDGTAKLPS